MTTAIDEAPAAIAVKSHYLIEPDDAGWRIVICRRGSPPEVILAQTRGEARRLAAVRAAGLPGYVRGGA